MNRTTSNAALVVLLAMTGSSCVLAAGQKPAEPALKMPVSLQATSDTVSRPDITARGARKLLDAAYTYASGHHWGMSIAVVDTEGRLVAFLRMDGAPLGTIDVAQGKALTAVKFQMPTSAVQKLVGSAAGMLTVRGITAVTGGYPVIVKGRLVGAIGVSGGLGDEDDLTARAALAAFKQ